jgi:hypothetical protein
MIEFGIRVGPRQRMLATGGSRLATDEMFLE